MSTEVKLHEHVLEGKFCWCLLWKKAQSKNPKSATLQDSCRKASFDVPVVPAEQATAGGAAGIQ
jgi:hypothetical protein